MFNTNKSINKHFFLTETIKDCRFVIFCYIVFKVTLNEIRDINSILSIVEIRSRTTK